VVGLQYERPIGAQGASRNRSTAKETAGQDFIQPRDRQEGRQRGKFFLPDCPYGSGARLRTACLNMIVVSFVSKAFPEPGAEGKSTMHRFLPSPGVCEVGVARCQSGPVRLESALRG
jgi:hypothetical protein